MNHIFSLLAALPLAPLAALHSTNPKQTFRRPVFRWNTVPVFAQFGKPDGPFTDQETRALSRFAYVMRENIQEMKLPDPAFETMRAAGRIFIATRDGHAASLGDW